MKYFLDIEVIDPIFLRCSNVQFLTTVLTVTIVSTHLFLLSNYSTYTEKLLRDSAAAEVAKLNDEELFVQSEDISSLEEGSKSNAR